MFSGNETTRRLRASAPAGIACIGRYGAGLRRLVGAALLLASATASAQDGTADPGFAADTDGSGYVNVATVQNDGRVLVGGNFVAIGGIERQKIARLNAADGSVDASFGASVTDPVNDNAQVNAIVVQPDGKILIGGNFTAVDGVTRNNMARLNADGSLDQGFDPNVDGSVHAIVVQPDGRIFVGGSMNRVGGAERASLARLNANGSLDTSFGQITQFSFSVQALLLQPDGKLVTGWRFTEADGFVIVRLNADGTQDGSFHVSMDAPISTDAELRTLARQPDGRILVGGRFSTINGTARNCIARVSGTDGRVDTSYDPNLGAGCGVDTILRKQDGSLFVAGSFDSVGGQPWSALARLTPQGRLDAAFDATSAPPNNVADASALAMQPGGRLIVGGIFSVIGGDAHMNLARLFDDKVFASGFE